LVQSAGEAVEGPTSSGDLRRRLLESASANRRQLLELELQIELARILRLPPDQVPYDTPMGALGLESLMALEFLRRIENALNDRLAKTLVWRYPTIEALTEYLLERLFPETHVVDAPGLPSAATAGTAISEDEALAALLGAKEDR
jgi:acyl carrier protein